MSCNHSCPMFSTDRAENMEAALAEIKADVKHANHRLETINKIVFEGNGKPGLVERMGSMETSMRIVAWVLTFLIAAAGVVVAAVR